MELRNNDKVFFEPLSHTYLLGEKELIGVTTLMKKHGLSPDYSNIPEATLMKAAEEGTAIHKEIEDYDNGLSVLRTPLVDEYVNICRENGLTFVENEYLVSDDELVASFIDGVYEVENGVALIDYKSTTKVHTRPLQWQLGIYKVFFERQNPGLKVVKCFCLHIDRKTRKIKGLIPIEPVTEREVDNLLFSEKDGRVFLDLYENPSAEIILTDAELTTYMAQQNEVARLKEQIKGIEETLKGLDKRVLDYMLEHDLVTLNGGGGEFVLKRAYERTTIDTERMKRTNPGLYEMYKKTTTVPASLSFKPNTK